MPVAAFRSFAGFAKELATTYLTAAVAAGATSIPINGTSIPASSTIFFIDGTLSESKAVSAGGGTSTLTAAALTNAHNIGTPIYYQLTAAIGPTDYLPLTSIDASDAIATAADKGIRGSNVEAYGVVQVAGDSDISLGGDVIPDNFGYLLGSIFGAVDFVTATANTHTFAGMNTAASNGQPTPFELYIYNGYNTRVYAGAKASELQIKYDPMQLLTWTAKFKGFLSGVVATPTPSFTAIGPQGAWQSTVTVAGVAVPNLLTADLTIKRTSMDVIQTLDGNQSPYKIWAGPLDISGTLNFVAEDDTILAHYLSNDQPAVVITLTNGTGATQVGLRITMTKTNFIAGWKTVITGSKGYVEVGGPIQAVANTTDSNTAGTGYSPGKVVLTNAKGYGFYQ